MNFWALIPLCDVLKNPLRKFWWVLLKKLSTQFGWILIYELKHIWFYSKSLWKWLQCSSFVDITLVFGANPDSVEVYMQTWLTMGLPFISDLLPDLMSMEALWILCAAAIQLASLQKLNVFLQLHQCLQAKKRMTSICFKIKAESTFQVKKWMLF